MQKGIFYDTASPSANICEKQVENLSLAFYHDALPDIDPLELETSLSLDLNEEFSLSGHPDIISRPGIDDLKFGGVKRRYQAQVGAYAYLAMKSGRTKPGELRIIHIPRTPIAKPQGLTEITRYDVSDCIHEASDVVRTIANQLKHFLSTCDPSCFPANPASILCSNKYCPAFCVKQWCRMGE